MRTLPALVARAVLLLAAAVAPTVHAASPQPATPGPSAAASLAAMTPVQQAEHWLRVGYDRPDLAQAALRRADASTPSRARLWLRTRAWVAARSGHAAEFEQALKGLQALPAALQPLAAADSHLARALQAEQQGPSVQAATHAQLAADAYARLCQSGAGDDCDRHGGVAALLLLARLAADDGDLAEAGARAGAALALAEAGADPGPLARAQGTQGWLQALRGDGDASRSDFAQAERTLRGAGRPDVQARLSLLAARAAAALGDAAALDRAVRSALQQAQAAGSPRLEALALTNYSDQMLRRGRPADALAAVQRALPAVRRHDDRRVERALMHNGALALIGLGRAAEARVQADRMLELWAAEGTLGEQAGALREVADALADAGQPRAALDLFHRERALNDRIMAAQRDGAERSLRVRYDRDSDQRRIELAARDNAIAASELHNQALTQRLWVMAAAVVAAAAVLVGVLLRRVQATQRSLERSQARLREQSEIDPLTGSANRRCGQQRLDAMSAGEGGFRGALLLVDVDHFKRVNDDQGHAAGDQVLVEVARRLQAAVRTGDLLVRWGGEEFLVVAPDIAGAALEDLALRLLRAVGETPVTLADGRSLPVTVSVGHAAFPLPPRAEPIGWERALNLADMALYTAKSQGRRRAVGLRGVADAPGALQRAEADFERAWSEGAVTLSVLT